MIRSDKDLFFEALDLATREERIAFLDEACRSDPHKRQRLDELLAIHDKQNPFMKVPAAAPAPNLPTLDPAEAEGLGTQIGRYQLLEKLGEGGFGTVYVAEQKEPVKRRVALKLIKLGMDTRQVVARFEAERQALAMMDHPNIAKVFDVGATATGRPYFVMELVRGVRLTQYCEENELPVSERLKLFILVCRAIQHAHQKGIIHRDIKPSNIMITMHDGVPVPKVIDFGIAKAIEGDLTEKTIYTQYQQFIGTPAYMSPEQAEMSGLDVDTRSDIYSLGVLLYELLTGSTPFDARELMESGIDGMRKIIGEKEPVRPSTRLRQIALAASPSQLSTIHYPLSTDLDWIVMMCLEKDRTRRYETANGLARDIERHLDNEPVMARPQSAVYKFQKFVRRNRAAVTVTAAILVGLVVVLILGWLSYQRERAARAAAQGETVRAESEATRAGTEAGRARQFQYASDMNLARQAVEDGNLFRALQLLDRHRPTQNTVISNQSSVISRQSSVTGHQSPLITDYRSLITDLRGWEWRYLWKQCEGEQLFILGSHSNGVTAVGFLPDGKTAFSAGNDHAVRLWDIETKRQVGLLPHATNVTGAACSPDGRWLATSTENRNNPLLIWDLTTHQVTQGWVTTNASLRPNSLAFSPDSKLLAFSELNKGVHVWSLAAGKVIARFPAYHHWLGPLGLAFSPDGQTLAYTENEGGEIALWNVRDQSVARRFKGHTWYVTALAFTPDGQLLVSGSADRTIKLWDATSGAERSTFPNYNFGPGLVDSSSVRLSTDGRILATSASGGGQRITMQEIPSGREKIRFRGHKHVVTDGAFSPDGHTYLSGSLDGTLRVWDVRTAPKETDTREFPSDLDEFSHGTSPAFSLSPDGRHLLTIFTNRTFSVWETPTLSESRHYPLPVRKVATAALAAGGQLAAFVAEDGNVVFWHGDTGETNWFARPTTNLTTRAVFSQDGKRFAIGGDSQVSVCDLPSGRNLFTFPTVEGGPMSLGFSPDGQKLMAGSFGGTVKVWDFTRRSPEATLQGHDYQVFGLALLPDGQTLVSAARDIRIWDLNAPTKPLILSPRPASFRGASISTDGRRLAVGAADGLITLWDVASKQEVATLAGHRRIIHALSFLPDGNTLLSVGSDQVRLWRAATLQEADDHSDSREAR